MVAETETALKVVDEESVRELFASFSDPDAFFADPEGTWIDRPRYRVVAQDLEMNSREAVVSWFRGLFDAVPDLQMEVEGVCATDRDAARRGLAR